MRIHVYAIREIRRQQREGVGLARAAAQLGVPHSLAIKALQHPMSEAMERKSVSVRVPHTHPGPYYCPGCGGTLYALPCVCCQGAVVPRPLTRRLGREAVVA